MGSYEDRGTSYEWRRWCAVPCISALVVATMLLTGARATWACSGPGPSFSDLWKNSTHLIRGRVVTSDAAHQNHIVQVESYIGNPPLPNYVFVSQSSPQYIQDTIYGFTIGDCMGLGVTLPEQQSFYMLVSQTETGVFNERYTIQFTDSELEQPLGLAVDVTGDGMTDGEGTFYFNESEFDERVEQIAGVRFATPPENLPIPLTAPLLVETSDGTLFFVPVDFGLPYSIEPADLATAINLNRFGCRDNCSILPETGFESFKVHLNDEPSFFLSRYGQRMEDGDVVVHSSAGTSLIWQDDTVTFYAVVGGDYLQPEYITWSLTAHSATPPTVWNPNATQFAYGDSEGIWIVDTLASNHTGERLGEAPEARLIWPSTQAIPIRFSERGRYLAIRDEDEELNLDLMTGSRLAGGIISPDERYLLTSRTDADGIVHWYAIDLVNPALSPEPDLTFGNETVPQIAWLDNLRFAMVSCSQNGECRVLYRYAEAAMTTYSFAADPEPGWAFAISPRGDVAVITDDDTISINRYLIDIESDSPITNVYWLPSMFWGE